MSTGLLPRRGSQDQPPQTRKPRTKLYLIGGILGAVLVVALGLALWPTPAPVSRNTEITWSAPQQAPTGGGSGVCNFPGKPTTDVNAVIPADLTWNLTGGTTAAPSAPSAGPLSREGGYATCFARTPSGVLLAASNLVAELANPELDMNKLIDHKVTHTPGYEALNQRVQSWTAVDRSEGLIVRQIAGYRLVTFSADHAVIEIVLRNTSGVAAGAMASVTYVLAWQDDDWKLVPPIDGGDVPTLTILSLTAPYIAFNGA